MELTDGIKQWLRGRDGDMQGRMGQFQYSEHTGVWPHDDKWKGMKTSGDGLWKWILENSVFYKMPRIEPRLLQKIAADIGEEVPSGQPIVDLGTGGEHAARDKLAPIALAVKASRVVLVDGSHSLLTQARAAMRQITGVSITRILDGFLDGDNTQYVDCPALVTYTGITVGNIEADNLAPLPPARELKEHIEHICAKSHGGDALITYDCLLDEEANRTGYEEHLPFHLNFLDQAVAENGFPLDVRKSIEYRDVTRTWYDEDGKAYAGANAHYAVFTKNVSFVFAGEHFNFEAGDKLLIKNSFKYSVKFFNKCAEDAGATVLKTWAEDSHRGCLLKAPDFHAARQNMDARHSTPYGSVAAA